MKLSDVCLNDVFVPFQLMLNSTIESSYTKWECQPKFQCMGACVVTTQIKRDVITASSNYTITTTPRWSDIVGLFIVNPNTYSLVNVTLDDKAKRIAFAIPVLANASSNMPEVRYISLQS